MAHGDVLTQEEFASIKTNADIVRYLELARQQLGLEKSEIRIMDWGCGRGNTMMKLYDLGYTNLRGVDVDAEAIERGRDFFTERGLNLDDYLELLDEDGRCQSPDDSFHFIYSYQVFEHVRDIETTVSEISRITMPRGRGLHIFPGPYQPIEGHIHMPLVHWVPKNELRRKLITAFTYLGVEANWNWNKGQPPSVRAERYIDFSFNQTYYRSYKVVWEVLKRYGLQATVVSMDHSRIANGALGKISKMPVLGDILRWAVLTFKSIEFSTYKSAAAN